MCVHVMYMRTQASELSSVKGVQFELTTVLGPPALRFDFSQEDYDFEDIITKRTKRPSVRREHTKLYQSITRS